MQTSYKATCYYSHFSYYCHHQRQWHITFFHLIESPFLLHSASTRMLAIHSFFQNCSTAPTSSCRILNNLYEQSILQSYQNLYVTGRNDAKEYPRATCKVSKIDTLGSSEQRLNPKIIIHSAVRHSLHWSLRDPSPSRNRVPANLAESFTQDQQFDQLT